MTPVSETSSPGSTSSPSSAGLRLGHVHLEVRRLDRAVDFYRELFGLEITERIGDRYAFLSSSGAHHDLALQALGDHAPRPAPGSTGLYHVAFEVDSSEALRDFAALLEQRRIPYSAVDHGISQALYFEDPDGNGLEVFLDRRDTPAGDRQWHGRSRALSGADLAPGELDESTD